MVRIHRRAHFEARRAGLQPGEIGARAVGRLARLRELLGARAFLQFAQVRLGFAQVGLRRPRLPRPGGRPRICSPGCASRAPATGRVRAPHRYAAHVRRRVVRSRRGSWCCAGRWRVPRRGTRPRRVARGPRRARRPRCARSCTTTTSPALTVAPSANGSETMNSAASATSSTRSRSSVPGSVLSSWRAQAASASGHQHDEGARVSRGELEAHGKIDCLHVFGDATDGDVVDAGEGDVTHRGQRHAARGFELRFRATLAVARSQRCACHRAKVHRA